MQFIESTIVIVDATSNEVRVLKIAECFYRILNDTSIHWINEKKELKLLVYNTTDNPISVEIPDIDISNFEVKLLLRHHGQGNINISLDSKTTVWYGGGGHEEGKQYPYNIYEKLSNDKHAFTLLTEENTNELWNWANNPNPESLPYLLRPNFGLLIALYILCQGYLLYHQKNNIVSKPSWWAKSLSIESKDLITEIDREIKSIYKFNHFDSDAIHALLKSVLSSTKVISTELVFAAHATLFKAFTDN
jgi:hypothetical protein